MQISATISHCYPLCYEWTGSGRTMQKTISMIYAQIWLATLFSVAAWLPSRLPLHFPSPSPSFASTFGSGLYTQPSLQIAIRATHMATQFFNSKCREDDNAVLLQTRSSAEIICILLFSNLFATPRFTRLGATLVY